MTRLFSRTATVVLALTFLAACSSTKKREPASLTKLEEKISVTSVWSTSVGKSDTFVMRPVLAGD